MVRLLLPFALILVVSLAGCIGDEAGPAPEPSSEVPEDAASPPSDAVDAAAGPSELPPQQVSVEASGTTSQGVWYCTGPHGNDGCQGVPLAGEEYTVHLPFDGILTAAGLDITWSARDPTLETMVIVHGIHSENGTERFEPFEATSPASLRLQDLTAGPDGMVYIGLWPAAEAKSPAGALFVDGQRQPFGVAGSLTVQPLSET